MAPVLEVDDVTKRFGAIEALKGVSLSIQRGEILGLVGDNGAGKSTLVKCISGVHHVTSGEIRLNGEPVAFDTPAEARLAGIETVYQHLALVENFDVAGNFFLGRELHKGGLLTPFGLLDEARMRRQAFAALEDVHIRIPGMRTDVVAQMSGGQRQAVAIARAAFWKGQVLLLDEPTAALGVEESGEVMRLTKNLVAEHGLAVLVISHNMEEVWELCDRVVVLRQGTQVAALSKGETSPTDIVAHITGAHTAATSGNGR